MRWLAMVVVVAFSASVSGAVTIDTVCVGNPGNANDTRYQTPGYGGVNYAYRIGKHEVTNSQYAEFLNAVAAEGDTNGLYNIDMGSGYHDIGGIARTGSGTSEDPWVYVARENRASRPVNYVSWYDTLRLANWLHNGQPTGAQGTSTTEDGAYDMSLGSSVVRKPGAVVFLPSEDEWYKAAYYKGGGTNAGYWDYPTQSDTAPTAEMPGGTDIVNGSANYWNGGHVDTTYFTTEVGAYDAKPSDSPYGTFDQGGNLWEWSEAIMGSWRGFRGGSFGGVDAYLRASGGDYNNPTYGYYFVGFRVASIHEPLILGDMNDDGQVNGLDVDGFVNAILYDSFNPYADITGNDGPNGLDVDPFVALVLSGGRAEVVPEPFTLALATIALGLLWWRRKRRSTDPLSARQHHRQGRSLSWSHPRIRRSSTRVILRV